MAVLGTSQARQVPPLKLNVRRKCASVCDKLLEAAPLSYLYDQLIHNSERFYEDP